MTLFFLVVGLEAKRELDLGVLRERRGSPSPRWRRWAGWPWRSGSTSCSTRADGSPRLGRRDVHRYRLRTRRLALVAGGAERLRVRILTLVISTT